MIPDDECITEPNASQSTLATTVWWSEKKCPETQHRCKGCKLYYSKIWVAGGTALCQECIEYLQRACVRAELREVPLK